MKKILMILLICSTVITAAVGCTDKYFISGTFFSDDLEGRTYQIYADGKISSDGVVPMSYEHLKDDLYILHLDKADVEATYSRELNTIIY